MNVQRFTAKTAREALALVRQALGDDAVVLSTRPSPEGVEVLALAPDGMARIEQAAVQADRARAPAVPAAAAPAPIKTVQLVPAPAAAPGRPATLAERIAARGEKLAPRLTSLLESRLDHRPDARHEQRHEPSLDGPALGQPASAAKRSLADSAAEHSVAQDVAALGMSTLTFQDYVRERMLKRRQAELAQQEPDLPTALRAGVAAAAAPTPASPASAAGPAVLRITRPSTTPTPGAPAILRHQALRDRISPARREPLVLHDEVRKSQASQAGQAGQFGRAALLDDGAPRPAAFHAAAQRDPDAASQPATPRERNELLGELRSVRKLIDERFGMLAFMERLQRDPRQATLSQQLFDVGLSPALVRKLVQSLPAEPDGGHASTDGQIQHSPDPLAWAAGVLQRNLLTDEHDLPLEDHDGVLALIGPTGVGKTTSCAKIAAAFASRHGANQLGLITLDAYRVAAHEQLRTYGRILGVPVHTAHDRASLEDLLELLAGKKLVLIDTAGMAQRDVRTRELLDMLAHRSIHKLLVVNAAAQGETVEDVMLGYGVQHCAGVIVSKLDEAVKLGPALDALIRHCCKEVGVANGQRVPEDWHRLTAQALVQRALRGGGGSSWRLDAAEVHLQFAATVGGGYPGPQGDNPAGRHGAALHA